VTRTALQNAASIAALMLTTQALVAEIPEKKPAPGPSGPATAPTWTTKKRSVPTLQPPRGRYLPPHGRLFRCVRAHEVAGHASSRGGFPVVLDAELASQLNHGASDGSASGEPTIPSISCGLVVASEWILKRRAFPGQVAEISAFHRGIRIEVSPHRQVSLCLLFSSLACVFVLVNGANRSTECA
jgi:hypothetical protein